MVKRISRDICLIKYRHLPLNEYEKECDKDVYFYPKVESTFWIKLEKNSNKKLSKEICNLLKKLNIESLIFLGEINKPWISKFTSSRLDYTPLIKVIEYFKKNKIEKRFNGAVKVEAEEFEKFIMNFYILTRCDGGFFDFNFTDENQNFIFYIHYSGDVRILTLNKKSNEDFLNIVSKTKFIDSMMENANRIS